MPASPAWKQSMAAREPTALGDAVPSDTSADDFIPLFALVLALGGVTLLLCWCVQRMSKDKERQGLLAGESANQ